MFCKFDLLHKICLFFVLFTKYKNRVFSGVRVTRFLLLYVCVVDRCLSYRHFSVGHCVVCSSSIDGFSLPPFDIFKLVLP